MTMWIDDPRPTDNGLQHLLLTVDRSLSAERHGISGTTGFTPFVVVVGCKYFLPVPVCLLFDLDALK